MDNKKIARVTGLLYLMIIICAGFSQGFVRSGVIVSENAAETASNILASEWLFRLGFVTDLIAFLCDAAVAISAVFGELSLTIWLLVKGVNRTPSITINNES